MAAKIFEVGDVLPATTQLRIYFNSPKLNSGEYSDLKSNNNSFYFFDHPDDHFVPSWDYSWHIYDVWQGTWVSPFNATDHNYIDFDISNWSLDKRTISSVGTSVFTWEDLNAPQGFNVTFEENGGTTITDLTEQLNLPTPLPTTTRLNHVFAGWYYDALFTQKANAGDILESNVTLYAKWYTVSGWFSDVADAIRTKDGTAETIEVVEFPDRIEALPSPKEEEAKTITPDFSSGNQVIKPTSGKVLSQITLTKPADLTPENIKKDVNIFGIVGTYQVLLPTLYTPSISISYDTLTITPNSNNGAFVMGYKIYVDNVLLDTTTSTTYDLSDELTEVGTYEIYVSAYATEFIDSNPSNVDEYVVNPDSSKAFVVKDILPATTQLKISWKNHTFIGGDSLYYLDTNINQKTLFFVNDDYPTSVNITFITGASTNPSINALDVKYYIMDISTWSESERKISRAESYFNAFTYEDLDYND